jgi:hypothetical protein
MHTDALAATNYSTYHYKDFEYNNDKGWMLKSTVDNPTVKVTLESTSITVSDINVIEVYNFVDDFKLIEDNELKSVIEVNCLDAKKTTCRISITHLKASGKTILNIFYIYKYWRQYHITLADKLSSYETESWSPLDFELPDEPVKLKDAGVIFLYHSENKSVTTYAGVHESDLYRAVIYFSKKGVTAFFYDNNGNLVSGLTQLRELKGKEIQTYSVEYESNFTIGEETNKMNINILQAFYGPTFTFSCNTSKGKVIDRGFIVVKK